MSITITTPADPPTIEFTAATDLPPSPDTHLIGRLAALEETVRGALRARGAALLLAAVYDRARLREAKARHTAERSLAVLLDSCFARQSALTDPAVRERQIGAALRREQEYAGKLERFLEVADAERRLFVDRQAKLLAENETLTRRLAAARADDAERPKGRRRRSR